MMCVAVSISTATVSERSANIRTFSSPRVPFTSRSFSEGLWTNDPPPKKKPIFLCLLLTNYQLCAIFNLGGNISTTAGSNLHRIPALGLTSSLKLSAVNRLDIRRSFEWNEKRRWIDAGGSVTILRGSFQLQWKSLKVGLIL